MPHNAQLRRTALNASLLQILFSALFFDPASVPGLENEGAILPDFIDFLQAAQNGEADVLQGVYVPDVLASAIVQQPADSAGYVSSNDCEITQFSMPSQFGNVGLLAHNDLCGRYFFQLGVGQEVRLIYGDGTVEYFAITQLFQYQASQPDSPYSDFCDLSSGEILNAEQMFRKVYTGQRHVTFQTCIAVDGISSWGRLFVVAEPASLPLALAAL